MDKLKFLTILSGGGDTIAPTVAITTNATSPTESATIAATITFSEEVTGFEVGDITITAGGSLASFATADNTVFTVNWTLAAGANTMDIAAGVCTDAAGNNNTAATQYAITNYAIKINDAFTDTNGTDLASHAIAPTNVPGNAWTNIYSNSSRNLVIGTNRCTAAAYNNGHYGLEIGVSDFILSCIFNFSDASIPGVILLRLDDLTDRVDGSTEWNCWQVRFGNGKLELYEHNSSDSNGTQRATANLTTSNNTNYTVRVFCVGSTISATVGATTISYGSVATHLTSTKVGVTLNGNPGIEQRADDFKVFF